ncbi:MAG: hypothetical protein MUC96_10165 [Myxococcaceae bacterium]|nr:hypothetical protein [Myxococcaceae bacterium]
MLEQAWKAPEHQTLAGVDDGRAAHGLDGAIEDQGAAVSAQKAGLLLIPLVLASAGGSMGFGRLQHRCASETRRRTKAAPRSRPTAEGDGVSMRHEAERSRIEASLPSEGAAHEVAQHARGATATSRW